jgi:hypothetical protein
VRTTITVTAFDVFGDPILLDPEEQAFYEEWAHERLVVKLLEAGRTLDITTGEPVMDAILFTWQISPQTTQEL